jgi:hypothetical protein
MARFAIVSSTGCCGFVLQRRNEFEAFDANEVSLGLFETEQAAVDVVTKNISAPEIIETSI